jgi:Fic family protein
MFFMNELTFSLSSDIVKLIAEIDEFKGRWDALKVLSPERLNALKHTATIESIGSSTRIEGVTLTDFQVETLLSNLQISSFKSRDEQEVVGYAEAMDLVFQAHAELRPTENHIKQLHQLLLKHSPKDERHRGRYKTLTNHVVAKDAQGVQVGIVFDTTCQLPIS